MKVPITELHRLYMGIHRLLKKKGYMLTLGYGSLLQAVRDGKRSEWDADIGLDCLVLLNNTRAKYVKEEVREIARFIKRAGYKIKLAKERIYIYEGRAKLDLQYSWYCEGLLGLSFGWYGEKVDGEAVYRRYQKVLLEDRTFTSMGNEEDVLTQIYKDWRTPDKNFKHDRKRIKRDKRYLMGKSK